MEEYTRDGNVGYFATRANIVTEKKAQKLNESRRAMKYAQASSREK